jgi:thiol-disulfide isomerase/thioredoxin
LARFVPWPEPEGGATPPGAALLLFGAPDCGVCQAIKPRLEAALAELPGLALFYIDCAQQPAACAQRSVFSLPVCRLYLDGRLALQQARVFSLSRLIDEVRRLHGMWAPPGAPDTQP